MNSIIGALIITTALTGTTPINVPANSSDIIPHIESDGTLAFGPTEEERLAEQKRIEEEAQKAAEEARKAEEERLRLEEEAQKNPENLDYCYDIASYSTKFSGSNTGSNRNYNMLLASDSINGTILKPGDTFSYNDVILSHRTPERDYKAAGVISGGKLVNATGGGICQVSSTLYQAALYSGMTITNRRNHSMRVGYMPAGRDATVSWGTIDFCFRNDLSVPIKIESTMNDGTIKIRFLAPENPHIGNIDINVYEKNGTYTLYRYINGEVDYSASSRYR